MIFLNDQDSGIYNSSGASPRHLRNVRFWNLFKFWNKSGMHEIFLIISDSGIDIMYPLGYKYQAF
jgi:hypothetical protein